MKTLKLQPLAGIDNASQRDDALQVGGDDPAIFVREARNVTIERGRASMRPGLRLVSALELSDVWQSPLHGDVFGRLGNEWVKINPSDWSYSALTTVGNGPLAHLVLNNVILAAGRDGLFQYDGTNATRFALDTPPAPLVSVGAGSIGAGRYGLAVAWLRDGMESPLSDMEQVTVPADSGFAVTTALSMDTTVTKVRLYMTSRDGGELRRVGDYTAGAISVPSEPTLGAAAQFQYMQAMPTGSYPAIWRGRLLTARTNVLRFSEALAYHIHDPRHGFVQMPQRITFVQPVAGGIWVGQVDHVAFLSGDSPSGLSLHRKGARSPLPGSAVAIDSQYTGEASAGGEVTAAWLAENGYVLGTAEGGLIETGARRLTGITGMGATVAHGGRLLTTTY